MLSLVWSITKVVYSIICKQICPNFQPKKLHHSAHLVLLMTPVPLPLVPLPPLPAVESLAASARLCWMVNTYTAKQYFLLLKQFITSRSYHYQHKRPLNKWQLLFVLSLTDCTENMSQHIWYFSFFWALANREHLLLLCIADKSQYRNVFFLAIEY